MALAGKTIAITGAARGLGGALAIVAADRGMVPVLLGRNAAGLAEIAGVIAERTGRRPDCVACDLADLGSVQLAAEQLGHIAPQLDILVNSGSQWTGGPLEDQSDDKLLSVINSTLTGTMALTRRLLPLLKARPMADIHTVVSMSGLPYARQRGSSAPFVAAKAGQNGFVQALTEELIGSSIRITSVHPGHIEDVLPHESEWEHERGAADGLSDRNVVEAILYVLDQPANVAIRSLVIERARTEFLS